jgi:hypothetical protein
MAVFSGSGVRVFVNGQDISPYVRDLRIEMRPNEVVTSYLELVDAPRVLHLADGSGMEVRYGVEPPPVQRPPVLSTEDRAIRVREPNAQ